ncbi:MAG TPA: ABC transporter permease [Planctomycetaceae bacterium]|nr:ABC transporter permease [Planctomycetaceae bacterium]
MNWVAWKMLTGDRSKYLGIVFGIAFAALLMGQQASIFCGLMLNTTSQIRDVQGADIWVMDPNVQFIDDLKPLSDNDLYRVRGVPGVEWAVRLYKGLTRARLDNGNFQQVILLGLDDTTLVGAPREIIVGSLADLRTPDAVIMDEAGYHYLWPNEPLAAGKVLEMNDRRAVIVGVCKASPTFQTFPIVYSRYSQACMYVPRERKVLSFVLAQNEPGVSVEEVCHRIHEQTGLQALHRDEFFWKTINYFLRRTGIPINFGITVALGFFVGSAIAGQTFYLFTIENLKQFGSLKAMGVSNSRIVGMILLQASLVGVIGYGIGIGMASLFGIVMKVMTKGIPPAFYMPWQILVGTAAAVVVIAMIASLLSIRKVLVLEPAIVFK